jgi:magnesium chelatase subunit D
LSDINLDLSRQPRPKPGRDREQAGPSVTGRRIGRRPWSRTGASAPLDIGATINASIIRQVLSKQSVRESSLAAEDLHLQIRSRRRRRLVVFVIDTSDSMGDGPQARIKAALGASLALASKAYLNRDQVCLVTFRDRSAQIVVPPTTSVTRVRREMANLPIGGATPLAAGLHKARQVIRQARAKDQHLVPLIVLLSDGEATAALEPGANPTEEALALAADMRQEKIPALVIDALEQPGRTGIMPRLAALLGAECRHINNLRAEQVLDLLELSTTTE